MTDHILFDLDGTLVDSAPICAAILNDMLRDRGSGRSLAVNEVMPWLSRGGVHMVRGLLGEECGSPDLEIAEFRARYLEVPTPAESLFEGVAEGLEELAAAGFTLAIASNKPQNLCEKLLCELGLHHLFEVVLGGAVGRRPKPDPEILELAMAKLGARPSQCLYVGDSDLDERAAAAAGLPFLMVSYGYHGELRAAQALACFEHFPGLVSAIFGRRQAALRKVA